MSYSVIAYLIDAEKVSSVYGSEKEVLYEKLKTKLHEDLERLDNLPGANSLKGYDAKAILKDIIEGVIRHPEMAYMYGYVYEQLCAYYGELIYSNENLWELDKQSAFIPIPFSEDFPHIISIKKECLEEKKAAYLSLEKGKGIGDYDYEEEMEDLEDIFDTAIEKQKDLVICCY